MDNYLHKQHSLFTLPPQSKVSIAVKLSLSEPVCTVETGNEGHTGTLLMNLGDGESPPLLHSSFTHGREPGVFRG